MVKKLKRKKNTKKKLSKKDYDKIRLALKKYNSNQEQEDTSSNIGYVIGIIIFIIFFILKLIN